MPIFRETIEKRQAEEIESIRNSSRGFTPHLCKGAGFTLIEIAIVLVIIGILLSIGGGMVGTLTKRAKLTEAREVVKDAREAVIGYAVKNGYLPANLDTAGARKLDAWGNDLAYYPTSEFDASPEDACGVNATGMEVYECLTAACETGTEGTDYRRKTNIAFVVYSKSFDVNGAGTGTVSPFKVRLQDVTYTDGGTTYNYDDVVKYVSLDEIRSLRGCPQQLVITSPTTLTTSTEDLSYSYELKATGGKSPYTWTAWTTAGVSLSTAGMITGTMNYCCSSGCITTCSTDTGELTTCSPTLTVSTQVSDSAGSAAVAYSGSIPVNPQALTINTTTLTDARTGVSYSVTLNGAGGRCTGAGCSTSYRWLVVGQTINTNGCSGNSYPITGANVGLCLYRDTGVLSGTPTMQGTYNFTVVLNDTCTTTSKAFTLNVIDSCFSPGMNIVNLTGSRRGFKRGSTGGTCYSWDSSTNLNAATGGSGGVQPNDIYYFYTSDSCGMQTCTSQTLNYSFFQGYDIDEDCLVRWTNTGSSCTFSDY